MFPFSELVFPFCAFGAVAGVEWLVAGKKLLLALLLIISEDLESSEDFKVLFVIGDYR
jgi:hypothetical protein